MILDDIGTNNLKQDVLWRGGEIWVRPKVSVYELVREGWEQLVFQQRLKRQKHLALLLAPSQGFSFWWRPLKTFCVPSALSWNEDFLLSTHAHKMFSCYSGTPPNHELSHIIWVSGPVPGDALEEDQTERDVRNGEGD